MLKNVWNNFVYLKQFISFEKNYVSEFLTSWFRPNCWFDTGYSKFLFTWRKTKCRSMTFYEKLFELAWGRFGCFQIIKYWNHWSMKYQIKHSSQVFCPKLLPGNKLLRLWILDIKKHSACGWLSMLTWSWTMILPGLKKNYGKYSDRLSEDTYIHTFAKWEN